MCDKCGVGLEITQDGHVFKGYSPFDAEEHSIKPKIIGYTDSAKDY